MRKDQGRYIKLYRVKAAKKAVAHRMDLEKYIADQGGREFMYSLVIEYLK